MTLLSATSASADKWPFGNAFRIFGLTLAIVVSFPVNFAISSAWGIPAAGAIAFHAALILLYVSYPVALPSIGILLAYVLISKAADPIILFTLLAMLCAALGLRLVGKRTHRMTWPVRVASITGLGTVASTASMIGSGVNPAAMLVDTVLTALVIWAGAYFYERERALRDRRAYWRERAQTDHLTTLYNRSRFERDLSGIVTVDDVGLLLIDADDFKQINDRYGHEVGDIALIHMSQVLQSGLSDPLKAYRIGGEEFAVIICNETRDRVLAMAEHIRNRVETSPLVVNGQAIQLTVSIGLTMGQRGDSPAGVMRQADHSLYRAKERGRNCVDIFDQAQSAA